MTLITHKPLDQLSSCSSHPEMRMQLWFTRSEITFQGIFWVLSPSDPLHKTALCPEPSTAQSHVVSARGHSQLLLPCCVHSVPLGYSLCWNRNRKSILPFDCCSLNLCCKEKTQGPTQSSRVNFTARSCQSLIFWELQVMPCDGWPRIETRKS